MDKKKLAVALTICGIVSAAFVVQIQAQAGSRPEPLLAYRFLVEIDGIVQASFLQVEGLNVTVDVIEYREGGDSTSPLLIPGLAHYGPLVLKNGLTSNNELLEWMEKTTDGTVQRKNLSIIILNAAGEEKARFNVQNAWPSSWSLGKLKSLDTGTVVEELVIQYEGFERASY